MDNLYIYSNEQLVEDVYTTPLTLGNGVRARLTNIKRNNLYNKIYFKFISNGDFIVNVYRGYYDENKNIQYELSNSRKIVGDGSSTIEYFKDNTITKYNFINYYIEIEALETISLTVQEMGLFFDDIQAISLFGNNYRTQLSTDFNSDILQKQIYDKLVNFNLRIYRQQIGELVHVMEKPYYLVHEVNCINNSTIKLSLRSISTEYVNDSFQWINVNIENIEDT